VQFPYPRKSFSAQVYNSGAYYQLAVADITGRSLVWQPDEAFTATAMLAFVDPAEEGFPPGSLFAGIRFRYSDPTANPQSSGHRLDAARISQLPKDTAQRSSFGSVPWWSANLN
jgi:hypothetical protein